MDDLDLLLIMSVNPGYGGQSYLPQATDKIRRARALLDAAGSRAVLEVDGGITTATIAEAWTAGADTFVAGTSVFGTADPGPGGARPPAALRRDCLRNAMSKQWTIVGVVVLGLALGATGLALMAPRADGRDQPAGTGFPRPQSRIPATRCRSRTTTAARSRW